MRDYLDLTSDATGSLFNSIGELAKPIWEMDLSLQHIQNLELYLSGTDPNGRGDWHLRFFEKEWDDEPTLANVLKWRGWLEERILAKRQSRSALCGAVLVIAQNGIKRVMGRPNNWKHLRGTVLSQRGKCVLDAIWHGRNQVAHVEGLDPNGESGLYFEGLEQQYGSAYSTAANGDFIPELMLKEILGWIDNDGPRTYRGDMLAVANLVGK